MPSMRIEVILAALSDSTRLRIMRLLEHMELAVGELAQVLGQSQPRVSRHLAILCDSGLAQRRREGSWVFLRSAISLSSDRPLAAALAHLLTQAEAEDAQFRDRCAEDRRRLAGIRSAREEGAARYFADHAEEWDRLRALLSPADEVEEALLDALGSRPLGRLLDIGTGTGRIAELLAPRASHVRLARPQPRDAPPGARASPGPAARKAGSWHRATSRRCLSRLPVSTR